MAIASIERISGNNNHTERPVQYAFYTSDKVLEDIKSSPAYRIFSGQPFELRPEVRNEPFKEILPEQRGWLTKVRQLPEILVRKLLIVGEK